MIDHYILLGNPVAQSLSPSLHQQFAKQTHQEMIYEKVCVPLDAFTQTFKKYRQQGIKGGNVTLPFKQEALQVCDILSERAKLAGAVNTFKMLEDGNVFGDNTDGCGLINDITQNQQFLIADKKVLLLGAGGAARGAIKPLLDENPRQLVIANRSVEKAIQLAHGFKSYGKVSGCGFAELSDQQFDLIINATSASLYEQTLELPDTLSIDHLGLGYDMVYGKKTTPFLTWCKIHGAKYCVDGYGMLIEQAAEAFYIWRGMHPQTTIIQT